MNLLTSGVMSSMLGASSQMQLARVPTAIYTREAAKLKPDQEVLERSSGYASKTMATAMEETQKTGAALEKAQAEAAAQEKAENTAKLEQSTNEKADTSVPDKGAIVKQPDDTIEISEEGKTAISGNAENKIPKPAPTDAAAPPIEVNTTVIEPKVYSSKGTVTVLLVKPEHQFSVKA